MAVLICHGCGNVFVDDPHFHGKCPKCGRKIG